jgi:hypothetical protein
MNKIYFVFSLISLLLLSNNAHAAAELNVVPTTYFVTEAVDRNRSASFRVDNNGDQLSRGFRLKLWASKDKLFTENEVIDSNRISARGTGVAPDGTFFALPIDSDGFFAGLETTVIISNSRRWTAYYSFSYTLPLGDDVTPGGNPKPLSGLLGSDYHFQACLVFIGETDCDPGANLTRVDQTTIVPPTVKDIKLIGDNISKLELTWSEVPFDNYIDDSSNTQSVDFVSFYRIERIDQFGAISMTELAPIDIAKTMVDGEERFTLSYDESDGLVRGKRNSFTVESCHNIGSIGAPTLSCYPRTASFPNQPFTDTVAALQDDFIASQDVDTGVRVDWVEPTSGVKRYKLKRCTDASDPVCVNIEVDGSISSYLDTNTLRGVDYSYSIASCDFLYRNYNDPNDPLNNTCYQNDRYTYTFGVAKSGTRGLVDAYEDDDTPAQATVVVSNASQLHSFDTPSDDDWIRIDLREPSRLNISTSGFNGENVDTVLSLFDANQLLLIENDDTDPANNVASFSSIESTVLDVGTYYIKATHFKLPIDGFPAPTANNYLLNIEILDKKINITAILQLLFDD